GMGGEGKYMLGEGEGKMAVVEVGYQTVNVVKRYTKADKGIAARANLWTSDKMKPIDISDTADEHDHQYAVSTGYRVPRAMELLNGGDGKIDVEMLKTFLDAKVNRTKGTLGYTDFSISNPHATHTPLTPQ